MLYVVPCLNTYEFCVGMMCGVYGYDERVARFMESYVLPICLLLLNTTVLYSLFCEVNQRSR